MPLKPGSSRSTISENISEFHTGKTYSHTKAKFGKKTADRQAIAASLSNARRYSRKYAEGGDVTDDSSDIDTSAPIPHIVVRPRSNAFTGTPEGVVPKQGQSVAPSFSPSDIQGQTQRFGQGLFEGFIPQSMKGPTPEQESEYQRKYSDLFSNPDTPPGKLDLPQIYNESPGQAAVSGALEGVGMFAGPPGEVGLLKGAGLAAKGLWPKIAAMMGGMGAKDALERGGTSDVMKSLAAIEEALGVKPGELQAAQQSFPPPPPVAPKSNKWADFSTEDVVKFIKDAGMGTGTFGQPTTGWHFQYPGGGNHPEGANNFAHLASKYLYINKGDPQKAISDIQSDFLTIGSGVSNSEKITAKGAIASLQHSSMDKLPKANWIGPNNPYPELVTTPIKSEPKSFAEASNGGDEVALKYLSEKVPSSDIPKFLQYYAETNGYLSAGKIANALVDMKPGWPKTTKQSVLNFGIPEPKLNPVDKIVDQMKDYSPVDKENWPLWAKVKQGGSAAELYKDLPLEEINQDLNYLEKGSHPWRDLYKVYLDRRQANDFGRFDVPQKGQEVGFNKPGFHGTQVRIRFGRFKAPDDEIGIHFGTQRAAHQIMGLGFGQDSLKQNSRIYPVVFRAKKTLDLPDLGNWRPDSMKYGLETFTDIPKDEINKAYEPLNHVPKYSSEAQEIARDVNKNFRQLLIDHGYDSIRYRNTVEDKGSVSFIVLDPKDIRSRFAKFEKSKISSSHLAAGLAGAGYVGGYLLDKNEPGNDKMANGGTVKRAAGGPTAPWFVRQEARNVFREGMLHSSVPGRTDHIPLNVPGGSYVVPADIVSALGQGNSQAGGSILSKMFKAGPYGMAPMTGGHASRIGAGHLLKGAKASATSTKSMFSGFAKGGNTSPTPIMAAGGEYVISPEMMKELGAGDEKKGFKIMDAFIKHVRQKHIKTLKNLPGPSKD